MDGTVADTPDESTVGKNEFDEKRNDHVAGSSRSSLTQQPDNPEKPEPEALQPAADQDKDVERDAGPVAERVVTTESARRRRLHHGHVNDLSSVPNGGLRAWLQVAGAFVLFFNTWGIFNTWGQYFTYYSLETLKNESPSAIAWIGSIQAFLLMFVGTLTGAIYDSGYCRELLLSGSFLVVFGHMMLSLCKTYWQVLLAQAFCIGIGMACLFIPSVAILATYFTTNLPFATGVAASGSSLGGVLYPIILQQLINKIGFPWAVRVIGFICLATLLIPNMCMKVRVLPPEARKLLDMSAFKDVPFLIFSFACFFTFLGLFQPFFFVQEYAITAKITSENFAFYLLSLLNATSIFGRILPNFVANKTGPLNIIIPCTFMTGVLILCLIRVHTLAGIVVVVLLFGFFSGSLVSLPPTIVVHLTKDRKFIGTRMGMSFAFISIGALVGSPIGGALIKKGFDKTWIFGGVLAVFGASLMLATRVAHKGWALTAKA